MLGVLPGIIGTIQATETIKLILGIGEPLIGRFLIYDALRMRFRELKLRKDADCPVCGTHPTVTRADRLRAVLRRGAAPGRGGDVAAVDERRRDMTVAGIEGRARSRRRPVVIVDVREPQEYQINRIAGSMLIPLGELPQRYVGARSERAIVTQCKSGMRSAKARSSFVRKRFTRVRNLTGGILGWIDQVDPSPAEVLKEAANPAVRAGLAPDPPLPFDECRLVRS